MDYDNKELHTKGECTPPEDHNIALDDERRVKVLSPFHARFQAFYPQQASDYRRDIHQLRCSCFRLSAVG